jgi:hypothetical protein
MLFKYNISNHKALQFSYLIFVEFADKANSQELINFRLTLSAAENPLCKVINITNCSLFHDVVSTDNLGYMTSNDGKMVSNELENI